ncbi:MAG: S-adenosylmethionine:tRNA ribosyltransferase-isomerase [Bacteroidota bacterium]|nr:S-adenosylmethionine:tRNA ribosyltransferase-isomerase [Bacteroidota bacterium]
MQKNLIIGNYTYDLPQDKVAFFPLQQRDASKLLVYKNQRIEDGNFSEIASYVPTETVLVVNNTRVIEARLYFTKETGGRIEIFCLQPHHPAEMAMAMTQKVKVSWQCLIGGASKWKPGQVLEKELIIGTEKIIFKAKYITKEENHFIIEFGWDSDHSFSEILHVAGNIPLPPYIKRNTEELDKERYQTIFAIHEGSVAAPTAALHFTDEVFGKLAQNNCKREHITLHVGAGTFKPVKTETIADHVMHAENFSITLNTLKNLINAVNIIAVGTTSLRTLESLYWMGVKVSNGINEFSITQWEAYEIDNSLTYKESLLAILNYMQINQQEVINCSTCLLIIPGYEFKSASAIITNFHQPRSTLLLLIAAFIGDAWKNIYDHALKNNYRFLSYGDSSLLFRK